jgi:hypothetical protein
MAMSVEKLVTASRWTGVRLWVYRSAVDYAPAAVLIRSAGRGRNLDQLACRGQAWAPPGSHASKSAIHALVAGLVACYGNVLVEAALQDVLAAEPPRGPQGGHGGAVPR